MLRSWHTNLVQTSTTYRQQNTIKTKREKNVTSRQRYTTPEIAVPFRYGRTTEFDIVLFLWSTSDHPQSSWGGSQKWNINGHFIKICLLCLQFGGERVNWKELVPRKSIVQVFNMGGGDANPRAGLIKIFTVHQSQNLKSPLRNTRCIHQSWTSHRHEVVCLATTKFWPIRSDHSSSTNHRLSSTFVGNFRYRTNDSRRQRSHRSAEQRVLVLARQPKGTVEIVRSSCDRSSTLQRNGYGCLIQQEITLRENKKMKFTLNALR